MKKNLFLFTALLFACKLSAQVGISLGMPLNTALTNEFNPSISGNGRIIVFEANTGQDEAIEIVISYQKGGVWTRPEPVPGVNTAANKLTYTGAANISYDGNTIFFSSSRYGGIGNKDIWYIEKTGTTWTTPKNLAKPVNSTLDDTDPSLSPDGRFLYFTRNEHGKKCGKIFVAERVGKDGWKEPKELTGPVNTGCEAAPRILGDNKTLYFSSGRQGGKGGMDLYRSQLVNNAWSAPEKMDFVNTDKDDIYVSTPAASDFLYFTGNAKTGTDIFRIRIPDHFQAEKVLMVQGSVKDPASGKGTAGKIVITTLSNKKSSLYYANSEGNYVLFLVKGEKYDVTFSGAGSAKTGFYSKIFDVDTLSKFRIVTQDVKIPALTAGSSFTLNNVTFEEDDKLSPYSYTDLDRLAKLYAENPALKGELKLYSRKETEVAADSTSEEGAPEDSSASDNSSLPGVSADPRTNALKEYLSRKGISAERLNITSENAGETDFPGKPDEWAEFKVTAL